MKTAQVPLPDGETLKSLAQSLAMLEAILCPEEDLRYHRFDNEWSKNESVASLDNGSGDHVFIVFSARGVFLKGFDHESEMSPYANDPEEVQAGVLESVPAELSEYLQEPAFMMEDTTFCFWRTHKDKTWQRGNPNETRSDGSEWLLEFYTFEPEAYLEWAEDYHEKDVSLEAVKHIFAHEPLTQTIVKALNPEMTLVALKKDIKTIGYISRDS